MQEIEANPNGDVLCALARELWDGLIEGKGSRFVGSGRLKDLFAAQAEVDSLDASYDYRSFMDHIVEAVAVLDGGKRTMSLKEAKRVLQHDVSRMTTAAYWRGYRKSLADARAAG